MASYLFAEVNQRHGVGIMDVTGASQALISVGSEQSSSEPGSLKSHASFAGRRVVKDTRKIWEFTHNMVHLPLCLAGATIGGAAGLIGGTVYKIYKNVRGQSADTKRIEDYAVKPCKMGYKFVKALVNKPLMVVSAALTVPMVFAGMATVVAGVTIYAVGCGIYKGFKHAIGEGAETKKLSEYAVKLINAVEPLYLSGAITTGIAGSLTLAAIYPPYVLPIWAPLFTWGFTAAFCYEDSVQPYFEGVSQPVDIDAGQLGIVPE